MKLDYLELTNFRCFNQFRIDFDPRLTVLIAPNGAGKTAALDAIAVNLGAFVSRFPDIAWDRTEKRDSTSKTKKEIPPSLKFKPLYNFADQFFHTKNI